MLFSLGWTALIMGLVGGPHCLAMCAAPCHAVIQGQAHAVRLHAGAAVASSRGVPGWAALEFHTGRLLGYGMLGAVAALATVLPAARQPQAEVTLAPREAPEGGGGYALTEHVKRYYKTAGV